MSDFFVVATEQKIRKDPFTDRKTELFYRLPNLRLQSFTVLPIISG